MATATTPIDDFVPGQYIIREEQKPGWVQIPPADTAIPAANWTGSQWTVAVVGVDNPGDPGWADSHRNVKNVSFGNQALQALPGDFDRSGYVDAADYNLWRRTFGTERLPFSGADGDGDGVVDADDYAVWRSISRLPRRSRQHGASRHRHLCHSCYQKRHARNRRRCRLVFVHRRGRQHVRHRNLVWHARGFGLAADLADGVTELDANDNSVGLESLITWTAPAAGVYFAEVRAAGRQ